MTRKDTYYEIDANSKREFNMYSGLSITAILRTEESGRYKEVTVMGR